MRVGLLTAVATAIAIGAIAVTGGGGGGGGGATTAANLYVDTTTGDNTCVRGSYTTYDSTKACNSFSAAYSASHPGDTIAIKGGSYTSAQSVPDETVTHALGSSRVVFCVYPSDTVTVSTGDYTVNAVVADGHDVTISGNYCGLSSTGGYDASAIHMSVTDPSGGMSTADPNTSSAPGHGATVQRGVTFTNVHTPTWFSISGGSTVEYSEIGPSVAARCLAGPNGQDDLIKIWIPAGSTDETNPTVGVSVLYNYIHDDLCNTGAHDDGIQAEPKDMTVIGNRFYTCGQLIDISVSNSAVFANFSGNTIIGNFFEEANTPYPGQPSNWCDQQSVSSGPPVVYEYNTNDQQFNNGGKGASGIVIGNIFLAQDTCQGIGGAATCDHNVFPAGGATQGTNAKTCTPRLATGNLWASGTEMAGNFHLSASDTCAASAGSSSVFPSTDIDQQTRTVPVWAGPDQP